MSYRIVFEGTKGYQFTLVQKVIVAILVLAVVSVISLPSSVFAASNNSNAKNKKGEASLELHSQSQDYVSIADADQTGLDITGDMTISLWVKPTTLAGNMTLISKWDHADKTSYLLFIENSNLGIALNSNPNGYGYKVFYAPYTAVANIWTNIAMVYTAASGTVEFFVNGTSTGKSSNFAMPTSIADTNASFMIGTRENIDTFYDGKIDDVRIWSRSLPTIQVSQLYLRPKKFDNSQLQGYWKFNGNANDESDKMNNLVVTTGVLFSSDITY